MPAQRAARLPTRDGSTRYTAHAPTGREACYTAFRRPYGARASASRRPSAIRPYTATQSFASLGRKDGTTTGERGGIQFGLEHSRDVLKPISSAGSRNGCRLALAPKTLACSSRRRQTACPLPTVARPSAHSARRVRGVQQPQLPREAPDVVDQRPRAWRYNTPNRWCACACACVCAAAMRMLWLRAASVRAARRAPAERHEASMEGRALVADLG